VQKEAINPCRYGRASDGGVQCRTRLITQCNMLILIWAFLEFGGTRIAQSSDWGTAKGVVTDRSGAVLPDVLITIVNNATGFTKTAKTNIAVTVRSGPGNFSIS